MNDPRASTGTYTFICVHVYIPQQGTRFHCSSLHRGATHSERKVHRPCNDRNRSEHGSWSFSKFWRLTYRWCTSLLILGVVPSTTWCLVTYTDDRTSESRLRSYAIRNLRGRSRIAYLVRTYGRACSIAFNSNGHESYICAKSSFVGNNLLLISKRRPTGKARYEQYWPSENRLSIINTR